MKDFFQENAMFAEDESSLDGSPLNWLKTIVLSIDWEITDDVLIEFIEQINRLQTTFYRNDKIILMFLKLLGSLGKYIKKKKANAHPDAIKLLILSYKSLEKITLSKDMTDVEKKIILASRARDFSELKSKMIQKDTRAGKQAEHNVKPEIKKEMVERAHNNDNDLPPGKAVLESLDDMKQLIKDEFKALRELLISLR
jgi:pilus assembly protein FimV